LADELKGAGHKDVAGDLEKAAKALDESDKKDDKDSVKKKGALNKVKRFLKDMGDKNSDLHKIVEGVKGGVSIAQDIGQKYNDFGQWLGLPQIPKPFLKDKK